MDYKSLPSRGARIEMPENWTTGQTVARRSPHGERGLKSRCLLEHTPLLWSLPSRGARIEMTLPLSMLLRREVAPLTGSAD